MTKQLSNVDKTEYWQHLDAKHHLHPFMEHKDLAEKGARVYTRASGCYIYDSKGNEYFDGMAGLWCVQLGYGRKELAEIAYKSMQELSYYNVLFRCTHPAAAELAAYIADLTPHDLNYVFFGCSGSDANDTAVKFIRYYWNLMKKPQKKVIISRERGYHGTTMAAASLSGLTPMHPQADLPLEGFVHIPCPYYFGYEGTLSEEEFGIAMAQELEKKIIELGADNVAAFIGEPIQGAGGLIMPPETYWPEIQRICRKYDVLLHADEVICGFGRTGHWFGSQRYNITPDIMTIAKGLSSGYQPISATILNERLGRAMFEAEEEWVHGLTYAAHPVATAVALENLRIIKEENIVNTVNEHLAPYLTHKALTLAEHELCGEVRTEGLLMAIELVMPNSNKKRFNKEKNAGIVCREISLDNGLIMRAVGDTMILSPPLIVTKQDIDICFDRIKRTLDETLRVLLS